MRGKEKVKLAVDGIMSPTVSGRGNSNPLIKRGPKPFKYLKKELTG